MLFYGQSAQAGRVANGSFEANRNFSGNAQNTMGLSVGSTAMTSWTVTNADLAWIGPSNPFGLIAFDGSYFLDLTGYHDSSLFGGVKETINTVNGQQYTLTFYLGEDSSSMTRSCYLLKAFSTPRSILMIWSAP